MELSMVEIQLLLEGLKVIRGGYDARSAHNTVIKIDQLEEKLKKYGQR